MEPAEGKMTGRASPGDISTKQRRIAELAAKSRGKAMTSLSHFIDLEWMREAYRRTRKDGAPGVDGQTANQYAEALDENLQQLLNRVKSGTYRAPPVKRAYIPKGKEKRPIGIPTFEDKVLQRAVVMVLEQVYEQEFHDTNYGFRPGRSAHGALEGLWQQTMAMGGGWIVDADIRKFFETLGHRHLRDIIRQRVRDGVLLRLIGKWLNAGVMEDGSLIHPDAGTPQGGVISPLLANIYLHWVLDEWFEREVKPRLAGRAFILRYGDDFVLGFSCERDARRVLAVLPKRFARYGMALHPDKTRLVRFRRPHWDGGGPKPGSFDFLGFTHHWTRSRRGAWVIKRKTAKDRFTRALRRTARWCRWARHRPIDEQHRILTSKLRGHYGYYGITGNSKALSRFLYEVTKVWKKWLNQRNTRRDKTNWAWFNNLLKRYPLPPPTPVHSALRLGANP